jgi:hypothetical protein
MNNHLMNNQERFVKWKCPECGNYHKWVWDIYDIFGGEITMTCDNPECGRTSKMCMVPEKNGNATALVADNSQVEEKLRRATEKVMNSQTEIDISTVGQHAKVLIEGDQVTIMGVKYQKVEEEPKEPQTLYDALQCPLYINGYHFNEGQKDWICKVVEEWLSQFHPDDMSFENLSYSNAFFDALDLARKTLR